MFKQPTERELEKAEEVRRDTYPPNTLCAVCGDIWMRHKGARCPANPCKYEIPIPGKTIFLPLLETGSDSLDGFSLLD